MKIKKIISLILSIIMLSSFIPMFSVHAEDVPQLTVTELSDNQLKSIAEQSTSRLPNELLQKLTLNDSDIPESMKKTDIRNTDAVVRLKEQESDLSSIVYVNRDGTYSEYFFSENVKYEKDGTVYDKSNVLTASLKQGGYTNEQNDICVILPFMITKNNGIQLSYENHDIEFIPKNTKKPLTTAKKTKDDTVIYYNAYGNGISLEYTAQYSGVKENIIISSDNGIYDFEFVVKTNGLYLKSSDNYAYFANKENEQIAEIGSITIFDNNGKPGEGSLNIEEIVPGEEYLYTVSVSEEFMKADSTAFPVIVDPTVTYTGSGIYDSQITYNIGSYTMNPTSTTITIGAVGSVYCSRMLLSFKTAVNRVNSVGINNLISARYTVWNSPSVNLSTVISSYIMNTTWGVTSTIGSYDIWNGYITSSEKNTTLFPNSFVLNLDLYDYFVYWNTHTYNGILLKIFNESSNQTCSFVTKESTSNKPTVVIKYYPGTLPTMFEDTELNDNRLYRIVSLSTSYNSKNMICHRTTNTSYSLSLTSSNPAVGNTINYCQFFRIRLETNNCVSITPSNACGIGNRQLAVNNTSYYIAGYSNGLSFSSTLNDNSLWYLIITNNGHYIVNKQLPSYCINVGSVDGEIYFDETTTVSKWQFIHVGLAFPLIRQETSNTCGCACGRMVLKNFSVDVSESDLSYSYFGELKTKINNNLPSYISNYYKFYLFTKPNNDGDMTSYDTINNNHITINLISKIKSDVIKGRPSICLISANNITGPINHTSSSHFIVIKGYYEIGNNKYIVICDPYYIVESNNDQCYEIVMTAEQLLTYIRNEQHGWTATMYDI